jgi:membrane dipeptidase
MQDGAVNLAEGPLLWDMIVPLAPSVGNDFALLDRYHAAGHHVVSLTVAGDDCGLGEAMHRLAGARRMIMDRSDRLAPMESVDDILAARAAGKLAVGLHLEGTECLERDPDMLDAFYALGIRHSILAFNMNNSAAGGCADLGDAGLTRLGRRFLARMREVGMLLDLSHTSARASLEAIDLIGAPVVFSHSNARSLHPHYRNLTDEQIRACAATGGLIGVSGSSAYIGPCEKLLEGLFRHIDYIVQLTGPEHVGLGTDYVADSEAVLRIFAERPDEWPADDGGDLRTISYVPPESIGALVTRMERAGYGAAAIASILGGNYLRIVGEVWR